MTAIAVVDSKDIARIEITLTVPPVIRFRLWLGTSIIKLGVRVSGCSLKVEAEDGEEKDYDGIRP